MVPYTYYRLCESERGADGKSRQRTVLGLGELTDFPTDAGRRELTEKARSVGAEHVCSQTLEKLGLKGFLMRSGWPEEKARLARAQIAARAIFRCSELRTVKYLRENSALCEIYGMDPDGTTKDTLHKGALDLYGLYREIPAKATCSIKFVWPQKPPSTEDPNSVSAT